MVQSPGILRVLCANRFHHMRCLRQSRMPRARLARYCSGNASYRVLKPDYAALLVIDVQGRAANICEASSPGVTQNMERMVEGASVLGVPVLWAEHMPDKLGLTLPPLASKLTDVGAVGPIRKNTFSVGGCSAFVDRIPANRSQVIVVGIETHVCVWQSSAFLHSRGYDVHVVADAVSSRSVENRDAALQRMRQWGIQVTTTEMALLEMLGVAEGDKFKAILKVIR